MCGSRRGEVRFMAKVDVTMMSRKKSEIARMNSSGVIATERNVNWYCCLGDWSAFGCDGCKFYYFCFSDFSSTGQRRRKEMEMCVVLLEEMI